MTRAARAAAVAAVAAVRRATAAWTKLAAAAWNSAGTSSSVVTVLARLL